MATKQIPHYDGVIDMEMTPEDRLAADEQKIEDEIYSEFLADDKSEWIVTVNKINPQTKKQQTCFKMSPGELPGLFERLRDEFGPGEYRAYVSKNGKVVRNLGYDIATPMKRTDSAAPSQLSDLGRILERQTEMIANLVRGGSPTPAPAPDPMGMFQGMMTALANARELFTPAPAPQSNIKEFIEVISIAKELTGDGGGGGKGVIDLLSELVKSPIAEEIAGQLRQEREKQTPKLIATNPPARQNPQLTATQPRPQMQPQSAPVPEMLQLMDQSMIAQLKSQVDFLVTRAAANSDPTLYAEMLCDIIPGEMIGAFFSRDDLMASLAYLNPAVGQFPQWFAEMKEAVNHILTSEGDGDDNGDDDNPPGVNVSGSESVGAAAVHSNGDPFGRRGSEGDARDNAATGARGKDKPGGARKGKGAN